MTTHDAPFVVLVTRGGFDEKGLPATTSLKRVCSGDFEAIIGVGDVWQFFLSYTRKRHALRETLEDAQACDLSFIRVGG